MGACSSPVSVREGTPLPLSFVVQIQMPHLGHSLFHHLQGSPQGVPLHYLATDTINKTTQEFQHSDVVKQNILLAPSLCNSRLQSLSEVTESKVSVPPLSACNMYGIELHTA